MSNTSKSIILSLIFLSIISCTSPKKDMGIIGIWETYEDEHHNKIIVTFYKDSVITELFGGAHRTNSNWTVNRDSSKIYFSTIKLLDTILPDITYDYIINNTKDTLNLKFLEKGQKHSVKFKKAKTNTFHSKN